MRQSNNVILGSSGLFALSGVIDSISVTVLGKNRKPEAKVLVCADTFRRKLYVWEMCLGISGQGQWPLPRGAKTRMLKMSHECQSGNSTRITALTVISFSIAVL